MAKIAFEQAIELVSLLLKAGVAPEDVQQTLIERFDLIEIMMKYPHAVRAMNPAAFEAFLLGSASYSEVLLQAGETGADEGVLAEYGYPLAWGLRPVEEQLRDLGILLPGLKCEVEIPTSLPQGAEGWLVVPKPSSIAETYNEAFQRALGLLMRDPSCFCNGREGKLGPEHLRLIDRSNQVLDELQRSTPGDYLVLGIQSGLRHRATSVRDARTAFGEREFGLGPLEVVSLLLTHPDRLNDYEHLGIDCPGCAYAPEAGSEHSHALYFIWDGGGLYLDCSSADANAPGFGSASGFLW